MKNIFNKIIAVLVLGLILTACDENAIPELTEPVPENPTFLKFFFHVENAPQANFYLNDEKVTAVNSSEEVQGFGYKGVYPSNAYSLVPSGSYDVNVKDLDLVTMASAQVTLDPDKNYSAYLVGTTDNFEVFVMEDALPANDPVKIYWRFVNTMAEMPFNVDAYAVKAAVPATDDSPAMDAQAISLGSNIAFKEGGEYVELIPGSYTFKVFETGSDYDPETSTPYIQHSVTLSTLGRIYTTQIRGTYSEAPSSGNIDFWRDR